MPRLDELRARMKKAGVYAYYIPTSDFHMSEYTNDYFKVREFFSGFTGSAGELLVTCDNALLWTDGRYFIQAERELAGSGITLMKSGEEGVDTLEEYLKKHMPPDAVLGFDGRTVSAAKAKKLKKAIPSHRIRYKKDLSEGIFIRPDFPRSDIELLDDSITGESGIDRIARLRKELKKKKCDGIFISKLEETAYLFNIRAKDIEYTPVPMSYAYIDMYKAYIFLNDVKADTGYPASIIKPYDEIYDFLKSGKISGRVLVDEGSVNYRCYKLLKKNAKLISGVSPIQLMKAVKNPTETEHIKRIYHKDSVQLTRFIKWITTTDERVTEVSAAEKLLSFRRQIPEFFEPSFTTIAAYGDNAAIIHYEPSADCDRAIERHGLFMVDSGGQYTGGTTDVTRTIVMGELTDEEKADFTDVTCGMLRIRYAHFLKGTTGQNLDILAREHMWKRGLDYKHGTGHGVGYMLSVHEGPQAIRWKNTGEPTELRPGMLISDEPGIYKEGKHGVRTENILLVEEDKKTDDGQFYRFFNLTQVPIDDRGMDRSRMSSEETEMYERYQREVCEALVPELDGDEIKWLYDYCGIVCPKEDRLRWIP
ncbi:MAG: aminopeptidase P family protein [Lachnospiraceae bacterium]|nr:aminopeptidase P family protein [Lachnospiraceae bacterium]